MLTTRGALQEVERSFHCFPRARPRATKIQFSWVPEEFLFVLNDAWDSV